MEKETSDRANVEAPRGATRGIGTGMSVPDARGALKCLADAGRAGIERRTKNVNELANNMMFTRECGFRMQDRPKSEGEKNGKQAKERDQGRYKSLGRGNVRSVGGCSDSEGVMHSSTLCCTESFYESEALKTTFSDAHSLWTNGGFRECNCETWIREVMTVSRRKCGVRAYLQGKRLIQ